MWETWSGPPADIKDACCDMRRSKTIQNLPPALFTLMKSTEPFSDLYYAMDVEGAMRMAGFAHVETREADHRHRAILGLAPAPESGGPGI